MLLLSSVYAKMQINGNLLCMLWMGTIVQNPSAVIPLTWKEHIDGVWKQLELNLYTLMSFRDGKREKFWVIFVSFLKTWQYKWPSAPGETVFVLFFPLGTAWCHWKGTSFYGHQFLVLGQAPAPLYCISSCCLSLYNVSVCLLGLLSGQQSAGSRRLWPSGRCSFSVALLCVSLVGVALTHLLHVAILMFKLPQVFSTSSSLVWATLVYFHFFFHLTGQRRPWFGQCSSFLFSKFRVQHDFGRVSKDFNIYLAV